MNEVLVTVPATVANLGPGFDVLGACVGGLNDKVKVALHHGDAQILSISGRDAELVPTDPEQNAIVVAARAMLTRLGDERQPVIRIERCIPISAGLGSSAAASVAGALGAAAASGKEYTREDIILAALAGESGVAGRHLDNIAPCIYGGVTIVRQVDPPDILRIQPKLELWLAVATPETRLDTKKARGMLPKQLENAVWIQQMANSAALVFGLMAGDAAAVSRSLDDHFAQPARQASIPNFVQLQAACLSNNAMGFGIAGAGPSVFALCNSQAEADKAAAAMSVATHGAVTTLVGPITHQGARYER